PTSSLLSHPLIRQLPAFAPPPDFSRSNPSAPDALPQISSPSRDCLEEASHWKRELWSANRFPPPAPSHLPPFPGARPRARLSRRRSRSFVGKAQVDLRSALAAPAHR